MQKRVGQEVRVRVKLAKGVIERLPAGGSGVDRRVLGQEVQDEFFAVATAGGADFPVIRGHSFFEIGASEAEVLGMKDRFQWQELVQDQEQLGISLGEWGRHEALYVGRTRTSAGR